VSEKFINNYVNNLFKRSSCPPHEKRSFKDDVAQQVHLELVESLGPDYLQKIDDQHGAEHKALVMVARRVIGRCRGIQAQRRCRAKKKEQADGLERHLPRMQPLPDEFPDRKDKDRSILASDWTDLLIDLDQGVGGFSDREKQIFH